MSTPKDDSYQAQFYEGYSNDSTYSEEPGVLIVPRIGNTPRAIQVHQSYTMRTQDFAAKKKMNPPVIPAPDERMTKVGSAISVGLPKLSGSNPPTWNWSVAGRYQYLVDDGTPCSPSSGFFVGYYPFTFPAANTMQSSVGGVSETTLRNALGAIGGGVITTDVVIASLDVPINTGTYFWPFTSILPASFFDPTLS